MLPRPPTRARASPSAEWAQEAQEASSYSPDSNFGPIAPISHRSGVQRTFPAVGIGARRRVSLAASRSNSYLRCLDAADAS